MNNPANNIPSALRCPALEPTTMYQINYDALSAQDKRLITAIAQRALSLEGIDDSISVEMDLCCVHLDNVPLDLARLEQADAFNFAHDIYGIARHLDRETGKLGGWFRPRFAVKKPSIAA